YALRNRKSPLSPFGLGNFDELDKWILPSLTSLSLDGPFTTYLDFRREADLNRFQDGNYRAAAIMYAAACESLLEDLLQHNHWEERIRPEDATANYLTRKGYPQSIKYLVLNELSRFYSDEGWRKNVPPAIVGWSEYVAQLRNRAVHEGYTPSGDEMKRCVEAVDALVTFLSDQAFKIRREHPITALAFLGREGIEKRGGWSATISRIEATQEDVAVRNRTFRRWANALSVFRSRDRSIAPKVEGSTCVLVFESSGCQSFYLIEETGVFAQKISKEMIHFSSAVEEQLKLIENNTAPATPQVFTLSFESIDLEEARWELYSYDVVPGYDVFLPPYEN
ncbi:hypothetical protein, partial [Corynebacterium sp. HMSC05E07]|uniref:hypothetical protein n=1 Tax=Corynebacterium sp. HMSC05E07 TaxID=1581117 RepID=UPI001AF00E2D